MDLEEVFPALASIDDDALRDGVREAWMIALADTDRSLVDLAAVPWFPPAQRELGLAAEAATLVDHVRDVAACAEALATALADRSGVAIDRDIVVAGALLHDVSKLYEYDGMTETAIGGLLGHPHYGVAVVDRAGLPVELAHIVLSHTDRTTVAPKTIEAELVKRADEAAAAAIRYGARDA